MSNLMVIEERVVLGREFKIYGTTENPLFLAKDVAEVIGHTDLSRMVDLVDDEEKMKRTVYVSLKNREMWFLTEDGLYEVLMQSRKPVAKVFKKEVKVILKSIRQNGMFATDNLLDDPDLLLKTVTKLKEERDARLYAEAKVELALEQKLFAEAETEQAKKTSDSDMRRARSSMGKYSGAVRSRDSYMKKVEELENQLKGLTVIDSRDSFNGILKKISKVTSKDIVDVYKEAYNAIIKQGVPVYTRRKEKGLTKRGRYKVAPIDCINDEEEWIIALSIVASMANRYCVDISSYYNEE